LKSEHSKKGALKIIIGQQQHQQQRGKLREGGTTTRCDGKRKS